MNRTIAPELKETEKINFIHPQILPFGKNSEWIWVNDVKDETVRLELHFNAGTINGNLLVGSFVNGLLLSGTATKSTTQINEELAQLGAFVNFSIGTESATAQLYCLRENFDAALSILVDAIENVTFRLEEVNEQKQDRKQRFLVSTQKMSVLARHRFSENFFTNDERYARVAKVDDFDRVEVEELKAFHRKFYLKGLVRVVCVANLDAKVVEKWKNRLSAWSNEQPENFLRVIENNRSEVKIEQTEAVQTAFRLGRPLFNRAHEDYVPMYVLETILGDYFGSRLMSNLREDKGYTYGIGSAIIETHKTGYLIIASEVKKEVRADAMKQIQIELERLQQEMIGEAELSLVKNYILGQLQKNADGPDAMMDLFLSVHLYGLTLDFYNQFIAQLHEISPEKLLQMAKKYLNFKDFTAISVG